MKFPPFALAIFGLLGISACASRPVASEDERLPAQTRIGNALQPEAAKKMVCGSVSQRYELGSGWARKECGPEGELKVTKEQKGSYRGRPMVMRMSGSLRVKTGHCDWSLARHFPGAELKPDGRVVEKSPVWSVEKNDCNFRSGKLPPLDRLSVDHPSVRPVASQNEAYKLLETKKDVDIDPAYNLGDGYYTCDDGKWYVAYNEVRRPRGLLWEGDCTYSEGDSDEPEGYALAFDIEGNRVD